MNIKKISASHGVLAMLCLMYFITYVDRVNVSTAAVAFKQELGLSNTQLGFVFSAFAYPYLVFQIIGGWVGDRFGARRTLFVCGIVWAGATTLTGFAGGLVSMLAARVLLGLGEGATFPAATHAMSRWTPASQRGFAQGITHAFARIGNAITPPMVAWLMVALTWRGSFFVLGIASLVWTVVWVFYFRDDPKDHSAITQQELQVLPAYSGGRSRQPVPWARLVRRMAPVTLVYFCYGLDAVAVPELDSAVFPAAAQHGSEAFRGVRVRRVFRRRGRRHRRWHPEGLENGQDRDGRVFPPKLPFIESAFVRSKRRRAATTGSHPGCRGS